MARAPVTITMEMIHAIRERQHQHTLCGQLEIKLKLTNKKWARDRMLVRILAFLLILAVSGWSIDAATRFGSSPAPECPCKCLGLILPSSTNSSSPGYVSAALAKHWPLIQQAAAVQLEKAREMAHELGGAATEWASHALLISSAWGTKVLSSAQVAATSAQAPQLVTAWLSTLQDSLSLLTSQAQPTVVYGPHLGPQHSIYTGGVRVTMMSSTDPWAMHRLAHAARRPLLLQEMSGKAPYASTQHEMHQVMLAAVQGHASLAGTTPAAAAQALQAADAAIADLVSKVQWTLRPLQHQGSASTVQTPTAVNTSCSSQERPAGLSTAAATLTEAAPAATITATALQQCVLPVLTFTQCNADPPAADLPSCPALDCKCGTLAADGLFKLAAERVKTSLKTHMAPAAAWTTSTIAKAKAATEHLKTEAKDLANQAQQVTTLISTTVTGWTKALLYSTRGWMRPAEQPDATLRGAALHINAQSWTFNHHEPLNSNAVNVTTSHTATLAAGLVM